MAPREQNRLLLSLPDRDREEIVALGQPVELRTGDTVTAGRGRRIQRVYFPRTAYLSLNVPTPVGAPEAMMVGQEGVLGGQVAMDAHTKPLAAIVQSGGSALCVEAGDFTRQVERSGALRGMVHAYVAAMVRQLTISCGCVHGHSLDARLARRLLMTHDCARRADFYVTHDFLATALGVRRVGVTNAATELQRLGLIRYQRGRVSVVDRRGLESASCVCYAQSKEAYARALHAARPAQGPPA
jgi:CRP-like cAMP-binding protein